MNQCPHKKHSRSWRSLLLWGFVAALLIAPVSASALDPAKSIYQYNCRSWTRQNGLPANAVNAITQTKDGYLWLGTSAGLVRFDGGEFKLYDVRHLTNSRSSLITSLFQSRRGGMWLGMESGSFGFFDGKNISLLGSDKYGGINLNVHKIMETEDQTLWIASEVLGARLTTSNTFDLVLNTTNISNRYDVTALFQDSKQRVWLGTVGRGLFYWQHGILTKFPDAVFDKLTVHCLAEDREGRIWIGTDQGLLCYDSNFKREPFQFPWYATRALLVDKRGTLWAGTSGGGLMRFDKGTPIGLEQKDGLADDFVTSLAEDDEGSLWVGTRNGLSQISDVKLPTFGKTEGLTANVNVAVSNSRSNGLWIATSDGFTYFDGIAHPYTQVGLSNSYIIGVFEARNHDLYVVDGSMNVSVVSGGHVMVTYPNKVWPSALVEDDQSIIAAIGGTFFRVGTNFFKPYEFVNNQPPPVGWVFNMALSRDGSIWVAADQGICRIKNGVWQLWTTKQGLGNSKIKWICEDSDGVIWAGLETGISRLKDGKVRNITRANGLFDDIINAIVPDDHGNLWVDSSRGFFRVTRQAMNDFADGKTDRIKCEGFDGLDDVKSSEKYQQQPSGCKTSDGRIWFPTTQGIVMIDPTNIMDNHVLPKVYLQSVRVNGRELDKFRSAVVQPGSGELEFHYAGVSYLEPLKIQYRYELEGYDKDWVEAGDWRAAFYTNLKPGVYNFDVQSRYEDGEWNVVGAQATLRLLPYFYQTFWFMGLMSSSLAIGIFGIYVWRVRHFRWNQGQLQRARDLLESKVQERTSELAYERDLLRTLLDNSPDQIYFKDVQSRFIKVSKALAVNFGVESADKLVGKTDFDFFSEEHARPAFEDEQEILRTGQPMIGREEKESWRDGRGESWVLTNKMPLPDKDGKIIGTFGISKDITALKQAQEESVYERDLLRMLLHTSPDYIYFKDAESRFIRCSTTLARQFGLPSAEELLGKSDFDLYPEEQARQAFADEQEIMRTGHAIIGKIEPLKSGQKEFWVLTTKMPLRNVHGQIIGTFGISKDITAMKQAEAKLFQAQKMETVGKLAGGIAHEFNSIMTAIIGQSELMLSDLPPDSLLIKNATEVRKAADRAATLTRQLLAFGRKQILQPEILNLNTILASMETVLRHVMGRDVDVRVVPDHGLKFIKVDAGQIEQVIVNIAMNAADAMPNGGKLTLETSNATLDQNYISRFPELKAGDYVMLAITDTGAGMSEDVKARIFDPFFTTKGVGQGTGLGLATCHGIIKQSGGHIAVYSEQGRGATFKIYLPQVKPTAKAQVQRLDTPGLPHGIETILLVEDDPALREMAGTLLERLGYNVMKAADGVEALSLTHQPGRGHIDLLFTDVVMPNMSGKELSDRIRALYPKTKILFTSAYTENAIVHQGVLNQGVALLQKPYAPAALAHKVREILGASKTPE